MKDEYSYGVIPLRQDADGIKVLLILHKGGRHWAFPKGHKNPGETDYQAAQRELKEETGLTILQILNELPYTESYRFYKFQDKVCKTVSYYPAFVEGILKLQPEEIVDARWVALVDASRHLTFKEAREICSKVQALLSLKGMI